MKNISRAIKIFWDDVTNGKNLDAYIAILIGITLSIFDIFGVVNVDVIGPSILLVLTLLVFGSLANRRAIKRFEDSALRIVPQDQLLNRMGFPGEKLGQLLSTSKSIDILGISLYRMVPLYHAEFLRALEKGCRLRVLLVSPDSHAMQMAAFRGTLQSSIETEKQRVQNTLDFLENLKRNASNANIEVKVIDYLPSYGITIIHPQNNDQQAYCFARIHVFRVSDRESPAINPDPIRDKYWFDFFVEQFEKMWTASQPIKSNEHSQKSKET